MKQTKYKNYSVDEDGNVYSHNWSKTTKMKLRTNKNGYVRLGFAHAPNKKRYAFVHRIMWETFKGDIPSGLQVNHIDGDKTNNSLSNLELLTPSENRKHAFRIGLQTMPKKINDDTLVVMILEVESGVGNKQRISLKYGMRRSFLTDVYLRNTRTEIWERTELQHLVCNDQSLNS